MTEEIVETKKEASPENEASTEAWQVTFVSYTKILIAKYAFDVHLTNGIN